MQAENKKNKHKFQHIWSEQMYRQWYNLQRQYADQKWKLIEYPSESWDLDSWNIILNQDAKMFNLNRKTDFNDLDCINELDLVNQALAKIYLSETKPQNKFWKTFENETEQIGILVPQSALVQIGMPNFKKTLEYIQLFSQNYPIYDLLKQFHTYALDKNDSKTLKLYHGLWTIIDYYSRFISHVDNEESKERVIYYLSTIWNKPNIKEALPSVQLTHAVITLIIDISRPNSSNKYNSENYLKEISDFVVLHLSVLETFFTRQVESTITDKENFNQIENVKKSFIDICMLDQSYIIIHDLIKNPNQYDLWKTIPKSLRDDIENLQSNSFINRFQSAVQKKSIIERLKSISSSQEQTRLPEFFQNKLTTNPENEASWHQLNIQSISQLRKQISKHHFTSVENKRIQQILNVNLQTLLNTLTMPVLKWDTINSVLMPLWNTCQHPALTSSIKSYDTSRTLELKESQILYKIKESFNGIFNEVELDNYLKTVKPFSVDIFIDKFNLIVKSKRLNINNRRQFSLRKMADFGITDELERSFKIRELYLSELLAIEEEVRPYILYVKKAFDSALPENKENFFNPYRHSIDGIEFDPETIQDVDKWLKGEVMKTINIKPQIHEALQINCFAMDSSGSMDHQKMRNLFKLIYLIITGLSGKASYDSFHFFGTYFVPAAEFNHSFNSKKLLYKILRKITHITSTGKIGYSEVGGTNLSGAISECHQRVKEFAKPFEKKEINHFKSLFVITDGEPSIGIVDPHELTELVNQKRQDGNGSIKGIYVGPTSPIPFMRIIFGENEFVETENFEAAIIDLIDIMSRTFKQQRQHLKQAKKQR